MSTYVGQRKRATIALTSGGSPADATVVAQVMDPEGTITAPTVVDDTGTGAYHADFTVDMEGRWWWRVAAGGAVIAAAEGYIDVERSPFVEPN